MCGGRGVAHRLSGTCPHRFALLVRVAGGAVLDDLEGELLQLGEQVAQFPGVVEQGLPGGELLGGEPPGDGPAADLAGPLGVGAVQPRRGGVAAAAGLAAGVGADGEGAGRTDRTARLGPD